MPTRVSSIGAVASGAGNSTTKTPGSGGRDGPSPDRRAVRHEADRAEQRCGVGGWGHASDGTGDRVALWCARHEAAPCPRESCRPTGPDRTGRGGRRGRWRARDATRRTRQRPGRPGRRRRPPAASRSTPSTAPSTDARAHADARPGPRADARTDAHARRRAEPRPGRPRAHTHALHRAEAHRQPERDADAGPTSSTRASSACARSTGSPACRPRSCSPTARSGAAPTGDADVATGVPVTPDTSFSVASVSKTFTAALILSLVEDGRLSLDGAAQELPAVAADPPGHHRPRAARPHQRPARLLLRGGGRPRPAEQAGAGLEPGAVVQVRRASRTPSRASSGTTRTRTTSSSGCWPKPSAGRPSRTSSQARFLGPLRLDDTFYQRPGDPWPGPSPAATGSSARARSCRRSTCRDGTADRAVHLGRHRGRRRGVDRDQRRRPRPLGGGALRRRRAVSRDSRDAMVGGHRPDGRLRAGRRVRARRPVGRRSTGGPTLGHSGRFLGARAVVRWFPRERIAIAVLTNQSRTDPNRVLASLLKLALQPQPDCLSCADVP